MDNLFSMLFNELDEQDLAQLQQQMMMDMDMHSLDLKNMYEQKMARAKESEENNKQAPIPCPHIDRDTFLFSFNMRLRQLEENPSHVRMRNTWITGKSHCCKKPLAELKPIHLAQMKVPFVHEGRFLACRVLTESIVVVGTAVLVEDTQRHVYGATFYNFSADLNNSSWLKPGTIVLIKEPYMKYSSIGITPSIRIDSPSDAIFVHKSNRELLEWADALCWFEPEALSAEELKKRGNMAFVEGDFEDALCHYQRALALAITDGKNEMAPVIHLNMAAALLELKRYPETVEEAKKALDAGADKKKAFYHLGCAAYGMRRWSETIGHFESALKVKPKLILTADKLAKAKARYAESSTGKYDLRKLFDEEKQGQRFMDVADYCGPVKVVDIPGKGKGLIVTEDVPKGTLLLAEKAYAIAFEPTDDSLRTHSLNLIGNGMIQNSSVICIIEAIQKLKREPQTANQLYGLYAGKETSNMPMPQEGVIDAGRIERICCLNSYTPFDSDSRHKSMEFQTGSEDNGCGLWILPSYVNHSCLGNTWRAIFGDLMMIRTLVDLKKGDEVTVKYLSPMDTYEKRHHICAKTWGFQCDCRLCELDRQEPPELAKERQELVNKYEDELEKQRQLQWSKPGTALAKLLPLVNGIRHTYRDRNELRTLLVDPLTILAYIYNVLLNEPKKALEAIKEILDSLEPELIYSYVPVLHARMAEIYGFQMSNHKMAKSTALKAYQMVQHKFGPMDKKLFLHIYPQFIAFMWEDACPIQ